MGPPDARLQHPAAPDADAALESYVVHSDRFAEAADSADFNIDDLAGLHFDCGESVATVADGFIETDRRFHPPLQHRVKVEVVRPERLLDHHKIELVPGDDGVHVLHSIRRIRVATQQNPRPAVAHRSEEFDVPAGLALQLDALISGGKLFLNLFKSCLNGGLYPNGNPT